MSRFDCDCEPLEWSFSSEEELHTFIEQEYAAMSDEERYQRTVNCDPTLVQFCSAEALTIIKNGKTAVIHENGKVTER